MESRTYPICIPLPLRSPAVQREPSMPSRRRPPNFASAKPDVKTQAIHNKPLTPVVDFHDSCVSRSPSRLRTPVSRLPVSRYHKILTAPAPASIRRALLAWYTRSKRDLPWRRTTDPYAIWISEVRRQQTRVAAVLPYYERILKRFPTVHELANAREQDVLAAWSGLGYYSRARNVQKAAVRIVAAGGFPSDYESIRALPRIGDYTAPAGSGNPLLLPHPSRGGHAVPRVWALAPAPG